MKVIEDGSEKLVITAKQLGALISVNFEKYILTELKLTKRQSSLSLKIQNI